MSTKDDKPDLSNLKSRLGLNKSAGKSDKKEEDKSNEKTGSGGQATATQSKGEKKGKAPQKSKKARGGSGGVNDRLAALKKSTLKSKKKSDPDPAPSPSAGQESAQPAATSSTPRAGAATGGGADSGGGGGARRSSGPPPGAKGPPPTAMAPPSRQQQTKSQSGQQDSVSATSSATEDEEEVSLSDFDLDDGGIFSAPVIVIFAVLLVVGTIFGYLASQSNQTREIEQTRINDAADLQTNLGPLFEDFDRVQAIISGLDPDSVDFEAAEELTQLDFVASAGILPGNRILLGSDIITPLNQYMADSGALQRLIQEHHRTTNRDRDELEAYMEQAEIVDDDEQIAVVFDLGYFFSNAQDVDGFVPSRGRLAVIDEELEADEDGLVEARFVAIDASEKVDIRSLIPIVASDFIDIDGDNALQRYSRRIQELQRYADELPNRVQRLQDAVDDQATADPPPLFTLVAGGDDEDDEEEVEELPDIDDGSEEAQE